MTRGIYTRVTMNKYMRQGVDDEGVDSGMKMLEGWRMRVLLIVVWCTMLNG